MVNKRLAKLSVDIKYAVHLAKKKTKPTILSIKNKVALIRMTVSSNLKIVEKKINEARVNLLLASIIRKRLKIIRLQEKINKLESLRIDIIEGR